jgi:hypothetical protein
MRYKLTIALALLATGLLGCQQHGNSVSVASAPDVALADIGPNALIKTAIQAHLAHNSNLRLDSFDMEVKQVTFDGDHAKAQVEFHAKSGGGTMQLTYVLAKQDGQWSVVESTPNGSNFSHPGPDKGQIPAAGGKTGDDSSVFQTLDKLHDGKGAPAQNLTPGHPPVVPAPKNQQP